MSITNEISLALQKGKRAQVQELVKKALEEGVSAKAILNEGLIAGMSEVGEKFKNNEVYVPEVLIAARAMNAGTAIIKPYRAAEGGEPVGKAVVCTVRGDLHDIGKNLVKMMFEGVGIECIDLGVDVEADKIIEAVKESGAKVIGLSSLLTTTMVYHAEVIKALEAAGMRDQVKVMIGGAPVTQEFADEIGADAYTSDAASAADVALSFFKN